MELLKGIQFFASGSKSDRAADHFFHRQSCTTASIAIQFGQDHSIDTQGGMEGFSRGDRVLSGHRIDHQEGVIRGDRL